MKKYFCCFKGESSRQGGENNDYVDEHHPFGNNQHLNQVFRHNDQVDLPDDQIPPDQQLSPSILNGHTFRWRQILDGTQNLRSTNLLGRGNFGEVYRCDFPSYDIVGAAKIQDLDNTFSRPEFMAEITALDRANHPNVVKLLGKCFSRERLVIVYEFMPNGSLDHHLFPNMRRGPGLPQQSPGLNWETRMKIALGVAEALVYVHDVLKVVHRDVKVGNVLLDENFVPKLTDFGLSTKIVVGQDGDEKQSKVDPIKGTPGCIDPVAETDGLVSTRSDVYSYGVLLYSLFTGRKAYDFSRPPPTRKLVDWLQPVSSREENQTLVVDPALRKRFSVEGLQRIFLLAGICIDLDIKADMGFVETMVRQAAAYEISEVPPVTKRHSR